MMYNPVCTYRIQFHKDFSLAQLDAILDYLRQLGVVTIYASPIFTATPGSNHGYDAFDPNTINPEIGTPEELKAISRKLQVDGMGWLQDIVPNHMAFDPRNPWIQDVLKNGRSSSFASFFDIHWDAAGHDGKLMVPFLGNSIDEVIQKSELKLRKEGDEWFLAYFDQLYPCNESSQDLINEKMSGSSESDDQSLVKEVHDLQHYRLCHWQETDVRINYRRFFTVNGLICLNIQDEKVFESFHVLIRNLVQEGIVQGLRIDHIDGLFDPATYTERLKAIAPSQYVTVEKILQPEESLPSGWQVEGNTGYDFLAWVNNLLTCRVHEETFRQFYSAVSPSFQSFQQQLRNKKALILYNSMQGELDNLLNLFLQSGLASEEQLHSLEPDALKKAIGSFLIYCPVYRFYGNAFPLQQEEATALHNLFRKIMQSEPELEPALGLIADAWLNNERLQDEDFRKRSLYFYQRCMQFSGPLMAKGFEDTLMYNYHQFIAHSEVGDDSDAFGFDVDTFHERILRRQKEWPLSMNATATHDTKRGEDVRARLNALSCFGTQWIDTVESWREMNASLRSEMGPDANDEYFIYQTLIGHYPFPGEADGDFKERLGAYLQKALRESKRKSNWAKPDEAYEDAVIRFATSLTDQQSDFWKSFQSMFTGVVDHGILNSLVQVLLKFTCPGIADVYQGTELWDLSFVDPDNRRPVDYEKRQNMLNDLQQQEDASVLYKELWNDRYTGKIKLWLTQQCMQLCRRFSSLLTEGEYIPLKVKGTFRNHVIAFARRHRQSMLIIAAPLHTGILTSEQNCSLEEIQWKDTRIELPPGVLPNGISLLNSKKIFLAGDLPVSLLFDPVPYSIVQCDVIPNKREAGLLMHLTSLPSSFGIGDMGPEARKFADFLFRSYQKYWQLLPINPTEAGQGHSPYSATSSKAGNLLFISPEDLVKDGYLVPEELQPLEHTGKTDYTAASDRKLELLNKAWKRFSSNLHENKDAAWESFCEKENWLEDFVLYSILKNRYGGKPWYEWPDAFKFRNAESLQQLKEEHREEYDQLRWLQFVFARQWKALKSYCNAKGIQLIGDIPFYVSYDSADVWAAPHLFKLDHQGNRKGVAGVPPDAFSADGQLWGMPVFRWTEMKKDGYQWWIERLRKNRELFDLIRLDHFRAFSAYWEVPAKDETAKNGKWIKGPGIPFFKAMKKALGELPFIAEDLGEIDEPVYALRDAFHMPGMKVLQFAFGEDMGTTPHAPHNYKENFLVYTGTHDNNTTRGWWRQEGASSRNYLEQYLGRKISEDEVPDLLCRMAYASSARIAILPVQDVLGLDEIARMNQPSLAEGNWGWRLLPDQLNDAAEKKLKYWTKLYNRR